MPQKTLKYPAPSARPAASIRWTSLILVVLGFSIGMIAHQWAQPGLAMLATCLSVALLVSVVAVSYVAQRRREQACREAIDRATQRLQSKLERHCPRVPRPHARRKFGTTRSDRQFLTVVRKSGRS